MLPSIPTSAASLENKYFVCFIQLFHTLISGTEDLAAAVYRKVLLHCSLWRTPRDAYYEVCRMRHHGMLPGVGPSSLHMQRTCSSGLREPLQRNQPARPSTDTLLLIEHMAAPNIADLFGDSEDEDDLRPTVSAEKPNESQHQSAPEAEVSTAKRLDAFSEDDDDDDFQDTPAPRQPSQLQEFSEEEEDVLVATETRLFGCTEAKKPSGVNAKYAGLKPTHLQERPKGPPQVLSGALLPLPPINKLRLLQTSKFMAVQTLPMTPANLKLERDSAVLDEESGEVKYGYKKQMTIRWRRRRLPSGETKMESNARFVKWSNGTTQLLLGDEVLDIAELDNTTANQFLFVRHTHPVAFIQGQGQLIKKLHLRPASLSSTFHRQLTADAARKHLKVNKVKATATVIDPNKLKAEREKAEEERIKSKENLQRRQEREMKKYPAVSRREYRPAGITPQFLETIEDEQEFSEEGDLEETPQPAPQRKRSYEEDEERKAEERLARAKQELPGHRRHLESKDEPKERATAGVVVSDEEDDEADLRKRQPAKKARRGLVLSDDEDDD